MIERPIRALLVEYLDHYNQHSERITHHRRQGRHPAGATVIVPLAAAVALTACSDDIAL